MVNIYDFINVSRYLEAVWNLKKERNNLFSIRAWARQLGFSNHTIIYEIIKGKRNISSRYVPTLVENLQLTQQERIYFEALISLEKSCDDSEQNYWLEKVQKLQAIGKMNFVELDDFSPFQDPLHILILEQISAGEFKGTIEDLHQKILFDRSLSQVTQAIEQLTKLGFLEQTEEGLKRVNAHIQSTPDLPSIAVKRFHQSILTTAYEQIMLQSVDEREYNSHILNINPESLPKAKELIRNFIKTFIQEIETTDAENSYALGIQLFALTKAPSKEHE